MIFIDKNSSIDKESLRVYALKHLDESKDVLRKLLSDTCWNKLHDLIGTEKNKNKLKKYREAESQLLSLPEFIDSYVKTALDSLERFELFVQVKAAELKSDDQQHNYFWALQIRHDQVVALVRVVDRIEELIKKWSEMEISLILKEKEFEKLADISIEDQVYLEAEKVYKERKKVI